MAVESFKSQFEEKTFYLIFTNKKIINFSLNLLNCLLRRSKHFTANKADIETKIKLKNIHD